MNSPTESGRGQLTQEKSLPKEELNQKASNLIKDFKTTLNKLEEFQAVAAHDIFTNFRFPVDLSFTIGEVEYRVFYNNEQSVYPLPARDENLSVSKRTQEANGDKFFSIELESRTPLLKFFPGGAGIRYYTGYTAELKFLRGLWGPMLIKRKGEEEQNIPSALQKAREMLAGLTPQAPQK